MCWHGYQLQFIIIVNYVLDFDSLQEYLGSQHESQLCDIEEDAANVAKFLDIFFPDFKKIKRMKLEKILALLRPNLFHERKGRESSINCLNCLSIL